MRFRSSAARCMGNTKGPNLSSKLVKLQAGWYGDSLCSAGASEFPSEADRFLVCPFLVWSCCGCCAGGSENVTAAGVVVMGVSPASGGGSGASLRALWASQYVSRSGVSERSLASLLHGNC
jgi:hypothetical protein